MTPAVDAAPATSKGDQVMGTVRFEISTSIDGYVTAFSASIGQQLLAAGRVDEVHLHVVPVLLGAGTRLVDDLRGRHVRLRRLTGTETDAAMHLRFAVVHDA